MSFMVVFLDNGPSAWRLPGLPQGQLSGGASYSA
jgi:hypothetical protein